jgi:copper oxidase (laccase) domain-containing protein
MGIVWKTIRKMVGKYGCSPENIHAAIGPGISRCCFETHADVPEAMEAALGQQVKSMIDPLPGGKFLVDLKGINALWMERAGIPSDQIEISDLCTACRPDLFWSHRHVGNARGVMSAVIQLI